MDHISPILRHRPGEVMVNFMYDFINRFINSPDPKNEQSLDNFFGTTEWRTIRSATDRETASVELYKEQLRKTGAHTYATSTRILKPLSDRSYFHLVYATRNAKGIIKFRDVEKQAVKEQDTVRATAQREHREERTGQTVMPFEPDQELSRTIKQERAQRLREAEERLYILTRAGPMPYEQLRPLVLELPLVWNSDLSNLLMREHNAGRITIQGLAPRQRTPKSGNIIRTALDG